MYFNVIIIFIIIIKYLLYNQLCIYIIGYVKI